jgi:hypothetical protein
MIPNVEASVVFSGFGTLDDFPNRSLDVLNCGSVVLKVQWPELVVPRSQGVAGSLAAPTLRGRALLV